MASINRRSRCWRLWPFQRSLGRRPRWFGIKRSFQPPFRWEGGELSEIENHDFLVSLQIEFCWGSTRAPLPRLNAFPPHPTLQLPPPGPSQFEVCRGWAVSKGVHFRFMLWTGDNFRQISPVFCQKLGAIVKMRLLFERSSSFTSAARCNCFEGTESAHWHIYMNINVCTSFTGCLIFIALWYASREIKYFMPSIYWYGRQLLFNPAHYQTKSYNNYVHN